MLRGWRHFPRPYTWDIETLQRDVSLQPEFSLSTAMTSSVMLSYLQARVERNPGITVRELPGHMAQLPAKVRAENGANEIAIRKFIKEHPEVFEIDKNDSVFVRPAVAKDVTSGVLLSHLQKCLEISQGIKLNELPGYLDPLPREVRERHCANDSAIRSFIEKHSEAFIIDSSDRVFIRPKALAKTGQAPVEDLTELCNVSGKIYRTLPARRFIGVEKPKTTIYFGIKQFEDGRHSDVQSAGVAVGPDSVVLDATRTSGHKAPFKATHVRRVKPVVVKRAPRSTPLKVEPESGDDDLYNQPGVVHTVKPNFGFITFGPKKRTCCFFHSSVVEKTLVRSCKDLADIFTVGDRVRFDAVPNTKPSRWVKWKATSVWRGFPEDDAASYQEKDSASEVFMSEGEDIEDLLNGCSSLDFSDVETEDYPVGIPDWEGPKARATGGSQELLDPEAHVPWTTRRKLSGVKAAFVRVTERTGLASWLDEDIFVHVIIDVVYRNGKQIKSFGELYEGSTFKSVVDVFIDAVKAREDLWVATLVWTGNRPAKLHVSLSENIFNRILAETVREKELSGQHSTEGASHGSADASHVSLAAPPSDSQLPITICPGSKGVVTDVQQCVATCSVQESGRLRDLQFTSFYKDGTAHMYNLDKVLKKEDTVSLDYMVGASQGKEEVHCDLVWQGQKPSGVLQLSPEDFAERLNNLAPSQSNTPTPRATEQLLPDPPKVCSGVTRGETCKPLLSTAQLLQASGIVINAAGQQLTAAALGQRFPGAAIAPAKSAVRCANVVAGDGDKCTPPRAESPHHEGSEPSVYIYEGAKGTIVRALESVAWAEVWEGGSPLEVEFTSGCFYQDGEVVLEDLNEVLARGDEVTLDYMVGSSTGSRTKKVVHCDLVWQGRKPRKTAGRLAPDEFAWKLNITEPCEGVVASFDDLSSQVEQQWDGRPEDSRAPLVKVDSLGKLGSVKTGGINSNLSVASLDKTSCKKAARAAATPLTTTEAVDAARSRLPAETVDALLPFVAMVTDQLRAEFRNELRQAIASCMELARTAVQSGTTEPGSPHPPASPSNQDELHQALASCMKPVLRDGTTQMDDPSSPAMNLSGEPVFYSPCTSPSWCPVRPFESWDPLPCMEPSGALSIDYDNVSQPAESSGGPLSKDGGAKLEVVPAMTEPSGTQAEENGTAYSAVADDGTADNRTAETEVQKAQLHTTQLLTTQLETTQLQTLELQTTELETTALEATELQPTELQTAQLQTTRLQTTELRTTQPQTKELQMTQLQTLEPLVVVFKEPADNSAADGRLAGDAAAESQGALDENDVQDLLETLEENTAVVSGCHPKDTVEPSCSAVLQKECSDATPEGSYVL